MSKRTKLVPSFSVPILVKEERSVKITPQSLFASSVFASAKLFTGKNYNMHVRKHLLEVTLPKSLADLVWKKTNLMVAHWSFHKKWPRSQSQITDTDTKSCKCKCHFCFCDCENDEDEDENSFEANEKLHYECRCWRWTLSVTEEQHTKWISKRTNNLNLKKTIETYKEWSLSMWKWRKD